MGSLSSPASIHYTRMYPGALSGYRPEDTRITNMLGWLDSALTTRWFWLAVLGFRLWNALFVRTAFNPDEYWQSAEVAHRMVFGYGYLTWEWQEDARLRGYAHPALFALLYKALALLGLDSRWAVAYGPRLLQGCIAAANDYFVHKLGLAYFDRTAARWALFCSLLSWFTFYVMVRPYSNSIETMCTTAALAHWPWVFLNANKKDDEVTYTMDSRRVKALSWAALGVLFRPTNAVLWFFLGGVHLYQSRDRIRLLVLFVLPMALVTLTVMLLIDRAGYGVWTFVPLNFFKFNVLEGKDKLYGVHPFSWYFAQAFPANVGTVMPIFLAGLLSAPPAKKELGGLIISSMLTFSMSAHKEFRFILPLLPPALVYAGYCLRNLERGLYAQVPQSSQRSVLRAATFVIVLPNIFAALYLSRWHQRAPIEVMDYLADSIQDVPNTSIHFWTPCHATPYYSFIHENVSMWFPDCSPANRLRPEGSESQQLEREPAVFLPSKYAFPHIEAETTGREKLPDLVVLFSSTLPKVQRLLAGAEYVQVASFYHSQVSGDADEPEASGEMMIYRRDPSAIESN